MGFSSPQAESQIVDCKAAHYDGDAKDLDNHHVSNMVVSSTLGDRL